MASSFMAMVYASLKANGIDTTNMSPQDAIKKFNELNNKEGLKQQEITKHNLGKINTSLYSKVTGEKIVTNKLVLPESNKRHSENRHGDVFEKYKKDISKIINSPDYIFQGKTRERVLVVKRIKNNVEVVLELSFENPKYSNKIVSMWELSEKDLEKLKNKAKTLYKK